MTEDYIKNSDAEAGFCWLACTYPRTKKKSPAVATEPSNVTMFTPPSKDQLKSHPIPGWLIFVLISLVGAVMGLLAVKTAICRF